MQLSALPGLLLGGINIEVEYAEQGTDNKRIEVEVRKSTVVGMGMPWVERKFYQPQPSHL